jgi:hypothetical protein
MALLTNINGKFSVDTDGAASFNRIGASTTTGFTFPSADGANGYVLKTNGSGTVSWAPDSNTGTVTGSGTLNKVARWTATGSDIGDGPITFSAATATATSTFGGGVALTDGVLESFNAQPMFLYSTPTTLNYELLAIDKQDAGNARLRVYKSGSGSYRGLEFHTNGSATLTLDTSQNATFAGNIIGNAGYTTEIGAFGTNSAGAIKRIRMGSGGEVIFGDSTNTNPIGITEGSWNQFSDTDFMSIYSRNSLRVYGYPGGTTQLMHVADDGTWFNNTNVGIGTTLPTTALTIRKAIPVAASSYGLQASMVEFKSYYPGYDTETVKSAIYSGVSDQTTLQTTKGFMSFWTSSEISPAAQNLTEKMRIEANGNVGIGLTTPTGNLSMNSQIGNGTNPPTSYTTNTAATQQQSFFNSYYVGATDGLGPYPRYFDMVATGSPDGTNGGSNIRFFTTGIVAATGAVERMRIKSNGNILVADTRKIEFYNTSQYIYANSTNDLTLASGDDINYQSNYNRFFHAGVEGARISATTASWVANGSNGTFGVNQVPSGSYNLEIAGSTYSSGSIRSGSWFQGTSATNTLYSSTALGTLLQSPGNSGASGTIYFRNGSGTVSANIFSGTITAAGDVIAYGSPSDKRLKENIKPIESALDKVSKLQGVTFDWKEKGITNLKEDIGFIAQDVQKVVPELVRENEDGMLSMRHQGIAPILLEAIKELKAEIEELKLNKCNCNCSK